MTAFKTTSMRIRGTSVEELEEAGLATDGLIESTAKLQSQIKALSGVDIMIDSETYKSTYQIMLEIAKVWDNISDINQAALLEALAGKRNSQVLMSVIQNLDDLTGSYEAAQNAAGAMEEANAIAMDTITGKTKALSASWQELSGNLLDSGIIKWFMDLAITVVNVVNDIDQATGGLAGQILLSVTAASALVVVFGTLRATAVAHGVTALVGAFQQLISVMTAAGPVAANGAGLLGLISPAGRAVMAISALITVGYNLYKAYRKANPTLGELREQMDDLAASCAELNQQLETNDTRIRELQSLESRTLIEDEELRKLREENALLAQQLAIEEGLQKAKQDQYVESFLQKYQNITTNTYEYEDVHGNVQRGFEGDIEALARKAEELRELSSQIGAKTAELSTMSPDDSEYNKVSEQLEELEKSYATLAREVEDDRKRIKEDVDQLPQDVAGAAKELRDAFELIEIDLGAFFGADAQTTTVNLIHSSAFADVKKYFDSLREEGKLTGETLNDMWAGLEDNDPLKQFLSTLLALNAIADITPQSLQQVIDAIYGVSMAAQDASMQTMALRDQIDLHKGRVELLAQAQEEMNDYGLISIGTLEALASEYPDLNKYLVQTADGYKLSSGALEDYIQTQEKEATMGLARAVTAATEIIKYNGLETDSIDQKAQKLKEMLAIRVAEAKVAQEASKDAEMLFRIYGTTTPNFGNFAIEAAESTLEDLNNALAAYTIGNNLRVTAKDAISKSSSEDDPFKERIEKEIKIYQHKREMDVITDQEYYDFLKLKLAEYEQYATKYEEEIWDLKQEIFNGQREMLDDWVNDQQKAAERVAMTGNIEGQLAIYRGVIDRMKKELDEAYAYGLDANSDYVQNLEAKIRDAAKSILDITKSVFDDFISYADDFNRWDNIGEDLDISKIEMLRAKLKSIQKLLDDGTISWEDYLDAYNETAKSLYDTQKESIETIIDLTMALIEQEAEDEIEALEDQADAYDELIEKKKELLEKTNDEADHEREVAELVREISKLQSKISQLSLDDSREAAAQRAELEEELYQKQLELSDLQNDYALDQTLEMLDKAQEANQDTVDAEKEAIEQSVDTWVKKYEKAIDRIDNDWDGLYKDLLDYQEEYRDSIDGIDSFETAWRNVEDTIIDVNENIADSISSTIKGIEDIYQAIENVGINPGTPNLNEDGSWDGTVSGGSSSTGSNKYSSLVSSKGRSIVQKMYNNSVKAAANPSLRDTLNQQNHDYAADYYWATGDELYYNAPSGTWHIGDSYNDPFLYEVYGLKKYHTGGYVGDEGAINDREVLSVLEKGELVLTKGHQFNLKKILSDMYAIVKAMTSINLPSFSTSATSPNGNFNANVEVNITHNGSMTDDDAKRYGSIAGDAALKKLYAAFNKRGIR